MLLWRYFGWYIQRRIDLSNLNWIEGSISTQVQQGSEANGSINTRSEKEVDEYGNPPSKLPDNIDIYIARYIGKDNSLDEKKVIPITKIGSEYKYKYAIEEDTNGILWAIVSNNEEKDTLKILVREDPNIDSKNPKDCFFLRLIILHIIPKMIPKRMQVLIFIFQK